MKTFNVYVSNVGNIPVFASSWEEAIQIVQAYIDKRSLNWTINETNRC